MRLLMDSFWRAAAYCIHPRVIALSFLPLAIMVALALGAGYFFWDFALDIVNSTLNASDWMTRITGWLETTGFGKLKAVIAPLIIVALATPFLVVGSLMVVALMMTPAMVSMVAERRFSKLERKKGGSLFLSLLWSLGSTLLALIALVASMPLWLIPPLVLILPPLIWGWLTYRVMAYDALSDHAAADERREVLKEHRSTLLAMGVMAGYLGAAPTLLWASGAMFLVFAPILVTVAIWVYTLVFAFSSLWFAHYCLAALDKMRAEKFAAKIATPVPIPSTTTPRFPNAEPVQDATQVIAACAHPVLASGQNDSQIPDKASHPASSALPGTNPPST